MNRERLSAPWSDEAITAWLDGEMSADEMQDFEQQLKRDQTLSARTAALMKSNQPFEAAFEPLLAAAPAAQMKDDLNRLLAQAPAPAATRQVSRRALIAASLSFLAIGSSLGYFVRPDAAQRESEKIRDLEAGYMSLYSRQTLADVDSSASLIARALQRTSQQMGLQLSAEQLALHNAALKSVRLLRYDDTSIVQIAWEHAQWGPVALCVSREKHENETGIQAERRHGMSLAWWHAGGYQFVLIGRTPAQQLQQSAGRLRQGLSAA